MESPTASSATACGHFFERGPHALPANRVHDLQCNEPVGEQRERPAGAPFRGRAARQSDQPGLLCAVQLAILPARGPLLFQGCGQAFLDESLPHAMDAREAGLHGLGDLQIAPIRASLARIGCEQYPSPRQDGGRTASRRYQLRQLRPFLGRESNNVLGHGGSPLA